MAYVGVSICIKIVGTIPGEKEKYIHVEDADKEDTYLGKDHFETMLVFSILVMGKL